MACLTALAVSFLGDCHVPRPMAGILSPEARVKVLLICCQNICFKAYCRPLDLNERIDILYLPGVLDLGHCVVKLYLRYRTSMTYGRLNTTLRWIFVCKPKRGVFTLALIFFF